MLNSFFFCVDDEYTVIDNSHIVDIVNSQHHLLGSDHVMCPGSVLVFCVIKKFYKRNQFTHYANENGKQNGDPCDSCAVYIHAGSIFVITLELIILQKQFTYVCKQ